MPVQLRFDTGLAGEQYVTGEHWRLARLERCPLHAQGGCGFARHGRYERKVPAGTYIARWYCPLGHCTFSLLPDHLAARLPGTLRAIERVVEAAEHASSQQACADALRPDGVSLPSAQRWLRRRLRWVRPLLATAVSMLPQLLSGCAPAIGALRQRLGVGPAGESPCAPAGESVLQRLRALLGEHLAALGAPLGFLHRPGGGAACSNAVQQRLGPDPPASGG